MPSSVPESIAEPPAATVAAAAGAPGTDTGAVGAVVDVAGAPTTDGGKEGAEPDVAARPHPVSASAATTRMPARTR